MGMEIKTIKNLTKKRLSKIISDELGLPFNQIQKIIRNKDVKIDGIRASKDVDVDAGSIIDIYVSLKAINIIFENNDIIVVFKPKNIEICSEIDEVEVSLINLVSKQINESLFAVHRLDRNTEGLVVFAKNNESKSSLDRAIKNRKLEKYYLTKVVGVFPHGEIESSAFLKKDEIKSCVYISDTKHAGFVGIKTRFKKVSDDGYFSILEVGLITGRTHQIRAHLNHLGYPVLGDEKYGNNEVNKKHKKRYQCLCAYKLVFHFEDADYLNYLNELTVELPRDMIKF